MLRWTAILLIALLPATLSGQVRYQITDTSWTNYNTDNSPLPDNFVSDIAFGKDGSVWIGTWGGGLVHLKDGKWIIFNEDNSGLPNNLINNIAMDDEGVLWLATDGDICRFDGTNWKTIRLPADQNIALTIEVDHQGDIWIGTYDQGLYKYDGRSVRKKWGGYKDMDFGVNDIAFDKDNTLWMATRIGILKYEADKWKLYDTSNSVLTSNLFYQLDMDSKGNLWAATYPPGNFAKWDGKKWEMFEEPIPPGQSKQRFPGNYIYSMLVNQYDDILSGSQFHGSLALFNGIEMEGIATPLPPSEMGVSSLEEDADGNIWVGSWKHGLYRLENPEPKVRESFLDSVQANQFQDRYIKTREEMVVRNRNIKLVIWDNKREDGDTVSVNLNGRWIVKDIPIYTQPQEFEVRISKDIDNHLILYAENLGRRPPNTAALAIVDSKNRQEYIIKSDFKNSGTIKIRYEPEVPTDQ